MSTQEATAQSPGKERAEEQQTVTPAEQRAQIDTGIELQGRWLTLSRVVWALVAMLSVSLFVAAIPATYYRLSNLLFVLTPADRDVTREGLAQLGISSDAFAWYNLTLAVARTLIFFAAAAIIFARKSNDLMAYFVSIFLLTFSVGRMVQVLQPDESWGGLPASVLITIAYSSFVIFFYVFPNGRFVPGWTRLLAPIWVVIIALAFFFPDSAVDIRVYVPLGMTFILTVILALGAFAQVYRYRRASSRTEKQQIKWVAYGATMILVLNVTFTVIDFFYPNLSLATGAGVLYQFLVNTVISVQLLIIPVALGISILRYRLWDIDLIINRTLVYIPLTGIVAGLYSASVALFQKIFQTLTGQQSDVAIILSTLILAALFTPIKNGLQNIVDRHFKETPDPVKRFKALGQQVEQRIWKLDDAAVTRRLFDEATAGFETGGALYMKRPQNGSKPIVYATEGWQDTQAAVTVPLQAGDNEIGRLLLGRRPEERTYRERDTQALQEVATLIAGAIEER